MADLTELNQCLEALKARAQSPVARVSYDGRRWNIGAMVKSPQPFPQCNEAFFKQLRNRRRVIHSGYMGR